VNGEELQSKLMGLLAAEQTLRGKALKLIASDPKLILHLGVVEAAMDLIDQFRLSPDDGDQDQIVVRLLSIRIFNAFGSALSLMLAGYSQPSAMILRDILETVFLLDYLEHDRPKITRWRTANDRDRKKEFRPVVVRTALDHRDGFTGRRRAKLYDELCDLAGHPSPRGFAMLRPTGMDAHCGPFLDPKTLEAVASEAGRLAIQVGGLVASFIPKKWQPAFDARMHMVNISQQWMDTFYSQPLEALRGHLPWGKRT
jgi:hypothetical protein